MKFEGQVYKFGDDVDTDVIIPARYLNTTDQAVLGAHCMEGLDPEFPKKVKEGGIVVAGRNFGCGSSREHAPVALKAAGVSCVVAKSFARIFYRNAFNVGLPAIECPEAAEEAEEGEVLEVDLERGVILNRSKGREYRFKPLPPFMLQLIQKGGLIPYVRERIADR